MKLIPTRPVTILSRRHGQLWFPNLHRHTDGSLLLYIEKGYDTHFSPWYPTRSVDNGRTWTEEDIQTPRVAAVHSFADGGLFSMDYYGVLDPKEPDTYWYYGAWSVPGKADSLRRERVRLHAPSSVNHSLRHFQHSHSYPTFLWWDLFNTVHGKSELTGDEVRIPPLMFNCMLEHDGVLLGFGATTHKDAPATVTSMFCYESRDRGRTWRERAVVARGTSATSEGFSEGWMAQLKNGQLYAVYRTGGIPLYHNWSSDGGKTWSKPEPVKLVDSNQPVGMAWPVVRALADGTLVMVWGRHGKHMAFDPSGTGRQWQGHLDLHAWELDTQALMGVPADKRLRGATQQGIRYWDSSDYLGCVVDGPRELLVCYDVQSYHEHWNAPMVDAAIRMVGVRIEN